MSLRARIVPCLVAMLVATGLAQPATAESPPVFLRTWGQFGTGPAQFDHPTHLAIDPAGDLYVADYKTCRIQKYTPDGFFLLAWNLPGGFTQWGDFVRYGPLGLCVAPDGTVLVATSGHRVHRYSGSGDLLATYVMPPREAGGWPGNPRGIACDANGDLIVGDAYYNRVLHLSVDGALVQAWNLDIGPLDVAVDPDGRILVLVDSGWIRVFEADGTPAGNIPTGAGGWGFGVDGDGNLYVPNRGSGVIRKLDGSGSLLSSWGSYGTTGPGRFERPNDVAVGTDGRIYVSDGGNNRVQMFAPCPDGNCPPTSQPCAEGPKLMLHIQPVIRGDACPAGQITTCADAVTEGEVMSAGLGNHFVYLLAHVGSVAELAGVQCGIDYQEGAAGGMDDGIGIDILEWHSCATLEFPTPGERAWPRPGGGTILTWRIDNCQAQATAVAGYFYVAAHSDDRLRLTVRPVDGEAKVANCRSAETPLAPADLGYVAFSVGQRLLGCNPALGQDCSQVVAVRPTTWSAIKSGFGR